MGNNQNQKITWNILDKIIAKFRYAKVNNYVKFNGTIVDIGCGQEGQFLITNKKRIKKGYGLDYKIKNHTIDIIYFINNKTMKALPHSQR